MTRIALGIEYDGRAFHGWQAQAGTRTVQGCLEQALAKVADHPLRVVCAGRTDAGVHALGQVVHFDTPARRAPHGWVFGANANLPPDVSVRWAQEVPEDFHARYGALRRHYRYVIFNHRVRPALGAGRVTWDYRPLDVAAMSVAAAPLLGEHDFSAYRAYACQAKSPVRTLHRLEVRRRGDYVLIDAEANAFLHHMVRNIAGVLMAIGAGERPAAWSREVLEGRERRLGGVTAPPDGLYFMGVRYPEAYGLPEAGRELLL
ncbi:MAG TPA: tRNA pseudouridine(38-40) synthase TruA [Gammaproteobacteria bacterium]|nr:tRNA pseudouridine(38-40) synthase TruA [Gammaproteobacteria bacterium]